MIHTLEIDALLAPEAADDLESFVGAAAAGSSVEPEGFPLRRERAADAEGGEEAAVGEHVDCGALLGKQHRVAEGKRDDVHAELEPTRAPRQRCHRGHALEDGRAADDGVGLPKRVDAARFAQIDPAPEAGG